MTWRFFGGIFIFFSKAFCPSKVSFEADFSFRFEGCLYKKRKKIRRHKPKRSLFLVDTYLSSTQKLCITRSCWSWHIVSFSSPKLPKPVTFNEMGGFSKNSGFSPKMDGENNGSKPYEQMDDLGGFPHIFGSTPKILVGL